MREISKPYEFALIDAHGVPTEHQYSVTPEKIVNPGPMIYQIKSCSVGRFTDNDYLVGYYLFNGNSFFTTAATTPVFGSTEPNYNYMFMLTHGEPIFNAQKDFGLGENWLGDPTLRMRYLNFEYNEDSPKICFDKSEIDFGKVKIDNHIKPIEDYEKASIKIINNGKSTLRIVTDGRLKEGYYSINGLFYIEEIPPGHEKTLDFSVTQISIIRDNEVWVPDEAKKTGKFSGEFYIMSNDQKYPVITIPFKGEVDEIIKSKQIKIFRQCSSKAECTEKCHESDPTWEGTCVYNQCYCVYP